MELEDVWYGMGSDRIGPGLLIVSYGLSPVCRSCQIESGLNRTQCNVSK